MSRSALSIAVVGDVIPSRSMFPGGSPVNEGFEQVVDLISGADVAVANLDTALTERGYPREKVINVRPSPEVAPDAAIDARARSRSASSTRVRTVGGVVGSSIRR